MSSPLLHHSDNKFPLANYRDKGISATLQSKPQMSSTTVQPIWGFFMSSPLLHHSDNKFPLADYRDKGSFSAHHKK